MRFFDCALVGYSFAPIEAGPDERRGQHLSVLWDRCGRFGMSEPVFPDRPVEFPTLPTEPVPGFQILAARQQAEGNALHQAVLFARHDTLGVVASLAPNHGRDRLNSWRDLLTLWESSFRPPEAAGAPLGECLMLLGLFTSEDGHVGDVKPGVPMQVATELADDVAEALTPIRAGGSRSFYLSDQGLAVWEGSNRGRQRIFAILAPKASEDALNEWVWWKDQNELVPLGRYVLNASKLRYEAEVHAQRRKQLDRAIEEVDRPLDDLLREDERLGPTTHVRLDRVMHAQARLSTAQQTETGLIHVASKLRELRRTVKAAEHNLRMTVPSPHPEWSNGNLDTLFARDLRLAEWLVLQLDADLDYAEAVLERAKAGHALTSLRVAQATEDHGRFQDRVSLLQTVVVSALVFVFTAVTAFGLQFNIRSNLKGPLIGAVSGLGIALPLLVANWVRAFGWLDRIAAVYMGLVLAWLAVAVAAPTAPPAAAIPIAAGVGFAGYAITRTHDSQNAKRWERADSSER